MYIIFFFLIFAGLFFYEILYPIAQLFKDSLYITMPICFIVLLFHSIFYGKKNNDWIYGLGRFLSTSQLLLIVLVVVYGIMDVVIKENDSFLGLFMSLIVGGIAYAYISFNYRMVKIASDEALTHKWYPVIVGAIGWLVNFLFMFA